MTRPLDDRPLLPPKTAMAADLMERFVARTGVDHGGTRRYLWTDAFAVCNLLALSTATGESRWAERAFRLVDLVHAVLATHRADDARRGTLSGLTGREAIEHPTAGGLRIGKPLPERPRNQPLDERTEWDRDGQYFHYLTRWMLALDRAARSAAAPRFNQWAQELARTACRAFCVPPRNGNPTRMIWKASIDLTRALVPSMGQHDPLDGYLTCVQLAGTARDLGQPADVDAAIATFAGMIDLDALATADPLGIGGLLLDAHRLERAVRHGWIRSGEPMLSALLDAALVGLRAWTRQQDLAQPPARRLAFRELGLAIGLAAVADLDRRVAATPAVDRDDALAARLAALRPYAPLREHIENVWLDPAVRRGAAWAAHEDIDDVMLATALLPEAVLALPAV